MGKKAYGLNLYFLWTEKVSTNVRWLIKLRVLAENVKLEGAKSIGLKNKVLSSMSKIVCYRDCFRKKFSSSKIFERWNWITGTNSRTNKVLYSNDRVFCTFTMFAWNITLYFRIFIFLLKKSLMFNTEEARFLPKNVVVGVDSKSINS